MKKIISFVFIVALFSSICYAGDVTFLNNNIAREVYSFNDSYRSYSFKTGIDTEKFCRDLKKSDLIRSISCIGNKEVYVSKSLFYEWDEVESLIIHEYNKSIESLDYWEKVGDDWYKKYQSFKNQRQPIAEDLDFCKAIPPQPDLEELTYILEHEPLCKYTDSETKLKLKGNDFAEFVKLLESCKNNNMDCSNYSFQIDEHKIRDSANNEMKFNVYSLSLKGGSSYIIRKE